MQRGKVVLLRQSSGIARRLPIHLGQNHATLCHRDFLQDFLTLRAATWPHEMHGFKDSLVAADFDHRFGDRGSLCTSLPFPNREYLCWIVAQIVGIVS